MYGESGPVDPSDDLDDCGGNCLWGSVAAGHKMPDMMRTDSPSRGGRSVSSDTKGGVSEGRPLCGVDC